MFNRSAYLLRENTGTTGVELTARTAVEILAHWNVPHLVVGGLAVQEHGYERVTIDVDLVWCQMWLKPSNILLLIGPGRSNVWPRIAWKIGGMA